MSKKRSNHYWKVSDAELKVDLRWIAGAEWRDGTAERESCADFFAAVKIFREQVRPWIPGVFRRRCENNRGRCSPDSGETKSGGDADGQRSARRWPFSFS